VTTDLELTAALEDILLSEHDSGGRITGLNRQPSQYSSSFSIELLEVTLQNGKTLPIVFKDLSKTNMLKESREIRHQLLYNPDREISVYRSILSDSNLNTAKHYGSVVNKDRDRYWLFIEKVPGPEIYQVGEFEIWSQVARWLAVLHARFENQVEDLRGKAPLLSYDRDYYQLWPLRAVAFSRHKSADFRVTLEKLLTRYERVIDRLVQLPMTLLHGDFYASNILVQHQGHRTRICPVDWDMAAIGPGYIDLAALISGQWKESERDALIKAYLGPKPPNDSRINISCCQLHIAIQWLGWSPEWRPPQEHQQDWIRQAANLAESLNL
jgi:hypothetical protein